MNFRDRAINIDSGNKCTLECAACARQQYKQEGQSIPGKDLTLEQLDKLTDYFKKISFCGTFSDPIFNPNFIEMLKLCKKKDIKTEISTAASQRPEKWYDEAFKASSEKTTWVFGIDGLPKDSHKYRIHKKGEYLFNIMLKAVKQGLKVQWQCIVFDYNKNDIKEVEQLAKLHNIPLLLIYSSRTDNGIKEVKEEKLGKIVYKITKPEEKKVFEPKCLKTKRDLAWNNKGKILPCCWLNTRYNEPIIKDLFNDSLHMDNNDTVEDIINSKEWIKFFNIIKRPTKDKPKRCLTMCTGPANSNPEENKVVI
jgi:MoaA/NifB/PqqE/SkfB family radical SAM enzyme